MGMHGFHVIDADGHGGEYANWQDTVPERFKPTLEAFREKMRVHYGRLPLPGGGQARKGDKFEVRPGMNDPDLRLKDMDLEGIDVTVTFPGGAGEEWAMLDPEFALALSRAVNDSKAAFCKEGKGRVFALAKLPMIEPELAAKELRRAVTELGLIGMVCTQHVRDKNLDHPSFVNQGAGVVLQFAADEQPDAVDLVVGNGRRLPLERDNVDDSQAFQNGEGVFRLESREAIAGE